MKKLTRTELYSLEDYAAARNDFRAKVMAHKKNRQVALSEHATLYFEDRLTIHYQIQEMLRAERIFEADGISEELDAYNPLIPDGCNWKATFMLEYPDETERRAALAKLIGVENQVWVQVQDFAKVFAVADEDLERSTDTKTSSVHFLRFELEPAMAAAVKRGGAFGFGCDHPECRHEVVPVPQNIRDSLAADLD